MAPLLALLMHVRGVNPVATPGFWTGGVGGRRGCRGGRVVKYYYIL